MGRGDGRKRGRPPRVGLGPFVVPSRAVSRGPFFYEWQAAGFERVDGNGLPAERVNPRTVPLGGDYWRETSFPVTSCDHLWIWPESQPAPERVYVGPWVVSGPYLSFAFGGWGGTAKAVLFSPQTTHVVPNPNADVRVPLYRDGVMIGWSEPQPAFIASDDLGRPLVELDGWFFVDVGLHAAAAGLPLTRVVWDVAAYEGSRIALVFEHPHDLVIACEHHLFYGMPPVDDPVPVWGFADLHSHPMAAKGFGGGLIAGDYPADSRATTDLQWCDQPHDHQPHYRDVGDFVVNNWPDGHQAGGRDGAPTFRTWPSFLEGIHQQMHPEWIRRARDGGLRLMVALTVNSEFLAAQHVVDPHAANDDWRTSELQVAYWNDVCAHNSDLMAIALDAGQAREIIASGRVAIVLGLEVDKAAASWLSELALREEIPTMALPGRRGRGGGHPHAPPTDDQIRVHIRDRLQQLWDLGIRQINPVHLLDNAFGAAAVYEEAFNVAMEALEHEDYEVDGAADVDFRLGEDRDSDTYMAAWLSAGYAPPHDQWNNAGADATGRPVEGHVNASAGLTRSGRIAIQEMMRIGFLIDVDHMSRATAADVLTLAEGATAAWGGTTPQRPYPLISAHASFRDMSPRRHWGDEEHPLVPGERAFNHIWPHESEKTSQQLERIRQLGGVVACIASHFDSLQYSGADGEAPVLNDCAGTSKTYAQELLYATDAMRGGAVGIGTDFPLLRKIGPRFGPMAAYGLTDEHLSYARVERHWQAIAQTNGVRYNRPAATLPFFTPPEINAEWKLNPYVWPQPNWDAHFGDVCAFATSLWDALSRWAANDPVRPVRDDAWEVLRGLRAATEADAHAVSSRARLTYQLLHGLPVSDPGDPGDPRRDYELIRTAINAWSQMNGENEPLERCQSGERDWDFNTDGLAHYGLLPDLLQDLHNTGLTPAAMNAIFSSAEGYLQAWEDCERWNQPLLEPVQTAATVQTTSARH